MKLLVMLPLFFTILASFCRADFVVNGDSRITGDIWYRLLGQDETDCDSVCRGNVYAKHEDMSGDQTGVRSEGSSEINPDIFGLNVDFGHYTIYKNRSLTMVDLADNKQVHCYLENNHTCDCKSCVIGWDWGTSIFRCETKACTESGS
ncbi:hypothetical protein BKA67DRAFT_658126 [Truncatella angustata]|uniref:Uncharacterized protein n=1 Tax=Truncatella angustata TaxID=152316 RepID=A0A9P8UKD7_9PEZI|nr:uncharacterized protein BKA67DRAFT_658126 [Truncatella angustata]KAH6653786.1 hypothetical protein BKA67DRAFT_658126 [Truncatella angustata]